MNKSLYIFVSSKKGQALLYPQKITKDGHQFEDPTNKQLLDKSMDFKQIGKFIKSGLELNCNSDLSYNDLFTEFNDEEFPNYKYCGYSDSESFGADFKSILIIKKENKEFQLSLHESNANSSLVIDGTASDEKLGNDLVAFVGWSN